MKAFYAWLAVGLVSACSSSNPTDDAGSGDASNDTNVGKDTGSDVQSTDATTDGTTDAPNDAPLDAPIKDAKAETGADASDGGSGNFTLTINDYLNWCSVSVNGGQASTADPQTFQFGPDASVALQGDTANAQAFYWGYWQSANIGDGGKVTAKNVNVTMNGNVNVLACCPVNNTALSCP